MSETGLNRMIFGRGKYNQETADLLFTESGEVKLPKLAPLALNLALRTGQSVTRQPTELRARAVLAAIADLLEAKGMSGDVRHSERNDTWAVYVTSAL